ncbi:hypothetical protein COY07_03880 [Candidatus Peregrinibacteria bacterium CG_4_10_14_0_2_um_filter_43_11]|nr:MAG: hypothetical protein COY07_03880 [Candidatus Peregrinibacteria bacterium CG_4_10_14_0_2_um_filter_43_11]
MSPKPSFPEEDLTMPVAPATVQSARQQIDDVVSTAPVSDEERAHLMTHYLSPEDHALREALNGILMRGGVDLLALDPAHLQRLAADVNEIAGKTFMIGPDGVLHNALGKKFHDMPEYHYLMPTLPRDHVLRRRDSSRDERVAAWKAILPTLGFRFVE